MAHFGKTDTAVNAALFFEKVMDHLQKLLAEFNELIRRVRHDEKFLQILQIGFDFFDFFVHIKANSPFPSPYDLKPFPPKAKKDAGQGRFSVLREICMLKKCGS